MQFLISAAFAVISLVGVASPCPSVCSCTDSPQGPTVDCRHRGLDSIPKDIPNNTTVLDLSSNKILTIGENAFNNLSALGSLDLSNNRIFVIGESAFNNLAALRSLDLSLNKIAMIEEHAFNNLPALQQLHLSLNIISLIEKHAFNNLPALQQLDLSSNEISTLLDNPFNNLPALGSLHLSLNKISCIEEHAFNNLPTLQYIGMKDNNILFVSEKTFQNLSQLTTLEFTMYCGCNFNIPFWQWFTEDTTKFPLSIGCYDYPQYYLEDLVQSDFYKCNEARSTQSTTKSRTTATPTSRTTITTTSAARVTRKKLEATAFAPRTVIGIAIGAGSLAGGILLLCVIWRLWRRTKDKDVKFEQQKNKINSLIPEIPPSTFPQRPTEKPQYII